MEGALNLLLDRLLDDDDFIYVGILIIPLMLDLRLMDQDQQQRQTIAQKVCHIMLQTRHH